MRPLSSLTGHPALILPIALAGILGFVFVPATTTLLIEPAAGAVEGQLDRISADAERIAQFERNVRDASIDAAAEERPVAFAGFLADPKRVKPGNMIDVAGSDIGPARAEVLESRRIAQSVDIIESGAARMDMYLVKARIIDPMSSHGDRVIPPDGERLDQKTLNLLFAVRPPHVKSAPRPATTVSHQSL